jgi:Mg/Co/Ni transporter MgtE
MDPAYTLTLLEILPGTTASKIVRAMTRPEVQRIVRFPEGDRVANFLQHLNEPQAARLLASLDPNSAADLLLRCGPFRGSSLTKSLAISIDMDQGKGEGANFLDSMDVDVAKDLMCMNDKCSTDSILLSFGSHRAANLLALIDRTLAIKLLRSITPWSAARILPLVEPELATRLISSLSRESAGNVLAIANESEWSAQHHLQLAERAQSGRDRQRV